MQSQPLSNNDSSDFLSKSAIDDVISEYINMSFQNDDTENCMVRTESRRISERSFSSLNQQLKSPPKAIQATLPVPVVHVLAPTPTTDLLMNSTLEESTTANQENEIGRIDSTDVNQKNAKRHKKRGTSRTAKTENAEAKGKSTDVVACTAAIVEACKQWDETLKTIELSIGVEPTTGAPLGESAATKAAVDKTYLSFPTTTNAPPMQSPREELKLLSQELHVLKCGFEENLSLVGSTIKQIQQNKNVRQHRQGSTSPSSSLSPSPTPIPNSGVTTPLSTPAAGTGSAPPSACSGCEVPRLQTKLFGANRAVSDTPRITSYVDSGTQTRQEIPMEFFQGSSLPRELVQCQADLINAWKRDYEQRLQVVASKLWVSPAGRGADDQTISPVQKLQRTIEEISKVSPHEKSSFMARWFGPKLKDPTDTSELTEALQKQQKANFELSRQLIQERSQNAELRLHLHRLVPVAVKLQEDLRQEKEAGAQATSLGQEYRAKFARAWATVKRLHEELFELQK